METFFGLCRSKLQAAFSTFITAMHSYAMPFFSNPALYSHCFPLYARLINLQSNGAASNIWGFHADLVCINVSITVGTNDTTVSSFNL
jgi:hypothetical protein